ncbi:MAG: NAD(P)H-dependent oxidoreductase [Bacteroidetes bacterium]|nr:NAD(P)H-dependent oxidoreductase [Bacteroidota bacterium]
MKKINEQILDAFNYRYACKLFDETKKVSEEDFHTILESARLSPTSFGFEPYQLLVVQDVKARESLRDYTWGANGKMNNTIGQLGSASHFVLLLSHKAKNMKYRSPYLQKFMRNVKKMPDDIIEFVNSKVEDFQKENFHSDTDRQITDWSARQTYIILANMLTTAAFLNIDSCAIEGFDKVKINEIAKEKFGVDTDIYEVEVMAAFGYRKSMPEFPKTRRPMEDIVRWI